MIVLNRSGCGTVRPDPQIMTFRVVSSMNNIAKDYVHMGIIRCTWNLNELSSVLLSMLANSLHASCAKTPHQMLTWHLTVSHELLTDKAKTAGYLE